MDEWMRENLERLQREALARRLNLARGEQDRMKLMQQFVKFKICTCIPMGRYETCCAKLLNVRDGFFYLTNPKPRA